MIKKGLLIVVCFIGLYSQKVNAQVTFTLSIDSMVALTPLIMNDTTDFLVRVRVDNSGSPDSIFGDIFYYYLTDSMMNAGDTARVIGQDFFSEMVVDGFIDVVNVDIQPNEIRASPPMNLIVIWPAMIDPTILDIDSITDSLALEGYLNIPFPLVDKANIIFPCPAMTFLYIKAEEIGNIDEMIITNTLGQLVAIIPRENLSGGWINVDMLNPGPYMAILRYKNGSSATMRFIKQ